MSFTRVNPGGWSVGAQLTSAQQNQLDIDHANAVDKAGGDTITGNITDNATFTIGATGTLGLTAGATFSGSWGAGNVSMGGTAVLQGNVAGNIIAAAAGVIGSNFASGIRSNTPGGIQLAGGSGDNITFSATRGRTWMQPAAVLFGPSGLPTGWTLPTSSLFAVGPAAPSTSTLLLLIPEVHNGATLASVSFRFTVTGTHASVPATLPAFNVQRLGFPIGGTQTQESLGSGFQSPSAPGSGAAWDASHNIQNFTYSCSDATKNTIDNTQFVYAAFIQEETGANAIGLNDYFVGLVLTYSGISDMRFA